MEYDDEHVEESFLPSTTSMSSPTIQRLVETRLTRIVLDGVFRELTSDTIACRPFRQRYRIPASSSVLSLFDRDLRTRLTTPGLHETHYDLGCGSHSLFLQVALPSNLCEPRQYDLRNGVNIHSNELQVRTYLDIDTGTQRLSRIRSVHRPE
jgi:hypothetical protein